VYPEVQTVTTDEELRELAYLHPTRADLEEWIASAIERGNHAHAYDISRLLLVPVDNNTLLNPKATSIDLDWQLRDMLTISQQNSKLAVEGNLRPFDDPLDGAALVTYQLNRITLRYDAYWNVIDATNAVLGFGFLPMILETLLGDPGIHYRRLVLFLVCSILRASCVNPMWTSEPGCL